MRRMCVRAAALGVTLLVCGPAVGQEGGITLMPAPNGAIACSGTITVDEATYTCDDVEALARARAHGADTGATLPAELEQAVTTWAAALRGGDQ